MAEYSPNPFGSVQFVPGSGLYPRSQVKASVGSGDLSKRDPMICWLVDINKVHGGRQMKAACEAFVRGEAIRLNFPCVYIRKEVHTTMNTYTKNGKPIRDMARGRMVNRQQQADPHMTVYLGSADGRAQVEGHLYTKVDRHGLPVAKMDPDDRRFVKPGTPRSRMDTELWLSKKVRSAVPATIPPNTAQREVMPYPIPDEAWDDLFGPYRDPPTGKAEQPAEQSLAMALEKTLETVPKRAIVA